MPTISADSLSYATIYQFDPDRDLQRAYITDSTYHWGSNQTRCDNGNTNLDLLDYGLGYQSAYVRLVSSFVEP